MVDTSSDGFSAGSATRRLYRGFNTGFPFKVAQCSADTAGNNWNFCRKAKINRPLPESRDSIGFTCGVDSVLAAGPIKRLFAQPDYFVLRFSCVPNQSPQETCLEGGELLRKARVYVCKSGRLVMQASSELIEESSC